MLNKFRGSLLGLAVGDAIGGPLEFMSANQILIKHGVVETMIGGGWQNLRPGQYTDDTFLMIATSESLIEEKKVDVVNLTAHYLKWFHTNPRDIGTTTRPVLSHVDAGLSIKEASLRYHQELPGKNEDNDFLPRCVPLSLLYFSEPNELIKQTFEVAQLTHFDPKIASGAVLLNLILSRIFNGETDKKIILSQVNQLLDDNEFGVYNVMPEILQKKKESLRVSTRMQDTIETAMWFWYKSKNFKDSIIPAINMGGDSDTIGAVIGALTGAYYGEESIPEEWLQRLEDKNIISNLGKKLHKIGTEKNL